MRQIKPAAGQPPAQPNPPPHPTEALTTALALALAAAVSLGLARFSYGLLLPAMRADLGWSYLLAGAMNTANAAGYLVGALLMPRLLARFDARALMLCGGFGSAALLALHAGTRSDAALLLLRAATGVASSASFVGGGLLAARLASGAASGLGSHRSGLILGLYYGGVGLGVIGASLLVPLFSAGAGHWPTAWLALAAAAALLSAITARGTRHLHAPPGAATPRERAAWAPMRWALAGYGLFGLGYIGYMTFVITLLRAQGQSTAQVTGFYCLLGVGMVTSSWLWAGLLQRHRDGRPLTQLNALLALATLLPVLSLQPLVVLASGALFGAVMLSVVASTTALVRHNLAPAAWASGISAFTILFAAGQIAGPSLTGWIADAAGGGAGGDARGLTRGLAVSAAV
ncbi:MAG: YbfB/YjiJ family MFS transporter, partial [Leptothrix sp. (in: b-proteobacteria)]